MRVVLDTNIVISGLFWHGPPRDVLDAAKVGAFIPFVSPVMLAELQDVLGRPKFADRLALADATADELILGYASLAISLSPTPIGPVIVDDPDDDEVLACAIAAQADAICSGDPHLLQLGTYAGIPILTAPQLLAALKQGPT